MLGMHKAHICFACVWLRALPWDVAYLLLSCAAIEDDEELHLNCGLKIQAFNSLVCRLRHSRQYNIEEYRFIPSSQFTPGTKNKQPRPHHLVLSHPVL